MLKSEVRRISKATGLKPDEFSTCLRDAKTYRREMRKRGGSCFFLREKTCSIYPLRPLVCRFYPFSLDTKNVSDFVFKASKECPGIGLGGKLTKSDFEKMFNKASEALSKEDLRSDAKSVERVCAE